MKDFSRYIIDYNRKIIDALKQLNDLDILTLFVVDSDNILIGTLTDGDIRRGLIDGVSLEDCVIKIIHKDFYFLDSENIDIKLIKKIREQGIKLIPMLSNGRIIKIFDLIKRKSILPIDVVLMAGGRGERLRPLTDHIPKPMLKVGDKPIIEHNIDNLKLHGVDNFYISVNYLAKQIQDYFGDGEKKGISIKCFKEDKPLGTMGSVSLIKEFKNDIVLVMNSDLFTNINYEDFYQGFIESNADMSVASVPYNVSVPFAILNLTGDSISSFEEKPTYTFYANAGIYLIKRKMLDFIPNDEVFQATDLIQTLIDRNYKVVKYPIIGYWVDIGRHEDYQKVLEFVKHLS